MEEKPKGKLRLNTCLLFVFPYTLRENRNNRSVTRDIFSRQRGRSRHRLAGYTMRYLFVNGVLISAESGKVAAETCAREAFS